MTSTVTKGALSNINTLQDLTNKTDQELAELIGYKAGSAISKWRINKTAPTTAGLAAEALIKRMNKSQPLPNDTRVLIAKGSSENIDFLIHIATKLGMDFKLV